MTESFWTAGARGQLVIARCERCGTYQHPPLQRCASCGGDELIPTPVSGRGRVATFTVNYEPWTPRHPVPFVFAAVELAEQPELYVFSNISGPVDEVRIGTPVTVYFEQRDDIYVPLFRPEESG